LLQPQWPQLILFSLDLVRSFAATLIAALFAGCSTHREQRFDNPEEGFVVTYYDRNHDGVVDFELHDNPKMADDAWALSDTKFTGRYDARLVFGYAFERQKVDIPVPRHVHITRGRPPVSTTR
jgi:hypothetical protein